MSTATTDVRTERIWAALVARRDAFDGKHSFLGPDVPPQQLQHATAKFLKLEPGERVLAFLDETVTANGKGGIVVTDRSIHTRQFGEGVHHQPLDAVRSISISGILNIKLQVNGRDLVTSTVAQNRPAVQAIRDALAEGLGLERVPTGPTFGTPPVPEPAVPAPYAATPAPPGVAPPPPGPPGTTPAGWLADPESRHQYRYWDGTRWTDQVADDGVGAVDPLTATAPAAVPPLATPAVAPAAAPAARAAAPGPVSLKLKSKGSWSLPAMCVVCAAPDVVGVAQYSGSDWSGKASMTMTFPLCAAHHALATQCGLQPDGKWKAFHRAPKELRPQAKEIQRAVKLTPPGSSFGPIHFTFANGTFGQAFRDLNP